MVDRILMLINAMNDYFKLKNYESAVKKWLDGLNDKKVKPREIKLMLNDLKVTFKAERCQQDIIFKCEKITCIKCSVNECQKDKYITFTIVENDNKKIIHDTKNVKKQDNDLQFLVWDIKNEEYSSYVNIISYVRCIIDDYYKNYKITFVGD